MKIKWCGVIFTFFNLAIVSFSSLQPLKAKTRFSLEYFEQTRQLRTQNLQRAKVNYIQTKKVTEGLHSYIDADLVSTNANVKQHVSFEEVRDFYLDLKSFYLQKEFNSSTIKNKTDLGFQELDSYSFVTRALNGPGLATQFTITNFAFFSTGYFLLPSYEQFYVKSSNGSRNSSLWSSQFHFLKKFNRQDQLILTTAYNYFSELGAETAFRSLYRNNSVFGDANNAQFIYDYSIYSLGAAYTYHWGPLKITPQLQWGYNESAFKNENEHTALELDVAYQQSSLLFSYIKIEKNALVAVYTPENIDMANVEGLSLSASHKLSKNFSVNLNLTSLNDKQSTEGIVSSLVTATYWSEL